MEISVSRAPSTYAPEIHAVQSILKNCVRAAVKIGKTVVLYVRLRNLSPQATSAELWCKITRADLQEVWAAITSC